MTWTIGATTRPARPGSHEAPCGPHAPRPGRGRVRALGLTACLVGVGAAALASCTPAPSAPRAEDGAATPTTSTLAASGAPTLTGAAAATPITWSESDLVTNERQLILSGERSGEGYFDPSGRRMIFQAEREPDNPFYQQYLLDLETGDVTRVSNGIGQTTCGWIHPVEDKVLFASTHEDPDARTKMAERLALRAAGDEPRYGFDYDPAYDIFEVVPGTDDYVNLTRSPGYDAEGSWSPDGRRVVFTSNRSAYVEPGSMSPEDREAFEADPSFAADIYVMDADGSGVTRMTDSPGYDGGPFFSPDGSRIVWRRFDRSGTLAEVWTMAADGSDQRQITRLGAMSWAPYYHPSGEYLIFTTNLHGFANFELYLVDVQGEREPVRVTFTDGPDVLPVFTPDGDGIAWVTRRGADGKAQIHLADWNDAAARRILALSPEQGRVTYAAGPGAAVAADLSATSPDIAPQDARRHVEALAAPEMEGREAGTAGEAAATAYVADVFRELGLAAGGSDGYFDPFEFTAGVDLGGTNALAVRSADGSESEPVVDVDWRPLSFSKVGSAGFAPLTFVGYGIVAPADGDQEAYDSYGEVDVTDRWVVALRYLPEDVSPERRQHLARHSSLRYKAMEARDRGAAGIVVLSGPTSKAREQLVPLEFDGAVAGVQIPAVSVRDDLAAGWFRASGKDLAAVQAALDAGGPVAGFELTGVELGAHVELATRKATARNVVGRLVVGASPAPEAVVVGAHVDHLGRGDAGDSLARDDEKGQVHPGADDNASGVAALLEIAQHMAAEEEAGRLSGLRRDVVFAAWSAEELGLLGSGHFAERLADGAETLQPTVAAYLNMDMVGRFQGKLVLQGVGSSPFWASEVERRNVVVGLPVTLSDDSYLPTDATSFYMRGVPVLSAFTGVHADYHTPRDTPDDLDYDRLAQTARLVELIARGAAEAESPPAYVKVAAPTGSESRRTGRVYLGTVPDYAAMAGETGGVLLSGVSGKSPAETAGVRAGDRVVELAGQTIDNIYDYTRVLDALEIGEPAGIVVLRDGRRIELEITPGSRE